ncbi:helix-turn-helix domain-containing protein [Azospirillum canadense]|uniref:helix-turn-helix domain-containing protein n=1 Tax=Azospirillum canadense TaxID=403962 RepID=UPI00222737BC|nr:helix-turn-helix domain-containing protein [Azospirillum canadense]MCW2242264.1 hypothetical protein [Azospirillum canadense]
MAIDPALRSFVKGTYGNSQGLQAFERSVQLAFDGAEAEIQRLLVARVKEELARALGESQPSHVDQWIDGVKGVPIEAIAAGGVAYFRFGYSGVIAAEALNLLETASPWKSGRYAESHIVLADGSEIAGPEAIQEGQVITITNKVFYAGRIEAGKKRSGEPWSAKAPLGVYRPVAEYLRRRWARFATVQFAWREFTGMEQGFRRPALTITPKWQSERNG